MLSALWGARWYLLLGVFSLLIFLALTVPLNFAWQFLEPQLGRLPVKVEGVAGTLWNGKVQVQQAQLGHLEGEWQLQPLSLLTANAVADIEVRAADLRGEGRLSINAAADARLENFNGFLDVEALAPLLRRQRVQLDGELEISGLSAAGNLNNQRVDELAGRLVYSGGDTRFPVERRTIETRVPMLIGNLGMDGDTARLELQTTESQPLGAAFLQADGWAGLSVRRRFVDVLGQKWPNKAEEDTVIFEVSRKIL